ncbi:MAG TPA: DNA-formamidopyrimidine glycosylase family protein [Chloroflexia bacterium]|nr:DNA-formamidopyrimidine glycosylase family protein [Chloroflexia bacterium]
MSEGPEIFRLAGQLDTEFGGSRIVAVDSRLKKARAWFEEHPGLIEGKEIRRVYSAGKNLLWDLEGDIYFHMHLLMFGKIRTYTLRHRVEYDRTTRALIVSTTRQAVLSNVQVFNVGQGNPFEQIEALKVIGPDICATPFDSDLFLERLNRPDNLTQEIAPVLLDQTVAAGLGNYLKSDILFECKMNPWLQVGDLTPEQEACLAETIPAVAQRALRNRGQTVSDEVLAHLEAERNGAGVSWRDKHWVFRHTNKPCFVCGTPVQQKRQGPGAGRVTFYCPECQQ